MPLTIISSYLYTVHTNLVKREYVLPLVVVDEVKLLKRRDDVVLLNRCLLADLVDGHRGRIAVGRVVRIRRLGGEGTLSTSGDKCSDIRITL